MANRKNKTSPLSWTVPIVDKNGMPTDELMRKWAHQTALNASIPTIAGVGFLVQTAPNVWTFRVIAAGTALTVTNGSGVAGNPTIKLNDTAVTPGIYGDGSHVGAYIVDQQGRLTTATSVAIAIAEANLTLSDITTDNVSITKHGFAPKAPNDATKFLNGVGAYSAPPAGYTDAQAEDAVGGILLDTAEVDFTYTSHTSIAASLKADSVVVAKMHASTNKVVFGRKSSTPGNPVVQTCSSATMSTSFATNPVLGNLIVVIQFHWSNSPTAASGFTQLFNANGSTGDGYAVYYKYAGVSEPKIQVVGTIGTASMMFAWEIAGVTGVIGTDLPFSHKEFDKAASPTYSTTSFNTGQANTTILGAISGCKAASGTNEVALALTGGVSPTVNETVIDNVGGFSRWSTGKGFQDTVTGSGTPYVATATFAVNQTVLGRMAILEVVSSVIGVTAGPGEELNAADILALIAASPTFTGTLTGFDGIFTDTLVVGSTSANSASTLGVKGTARGLRFGTATTYSVIQGVDQTLVGSYQALKIGGLDLAFQTNGTTDALTIDSSQASTFHGTVTMAVNQNAQSIGVVSNTDAGTSAGAAWRAYNGTHLAELLQFGTGFTTVGIFRQDGALVYGDGAGGVTVATGANQPVYIAVNNNQVAKFEASLITLNQPIVIPSGAAGFYETGNWVPVDGSVSAIVFTVVYARFTRTGNQVTVRAFLQFPPTVSAAGVNIAGLPYPATSPYGIGALFTNAGAGAANAIAVVPGGGSSVTINNYTTGAAVINSVFSNVNLLFEVTYEI